MSPVSAKKADGITMVKLAGRRHPPANESPGMPFSRVERIAFGVGLGMIALLAVALIPAWLSYAKSRHVTEPAAIPVVAHRATTVSHPAATANRPPPSSYAKTPLLPPTVRGQTGTRAAAPTRAPVPATQSKVTLAASRGDCWMEVRAGSSTGRLVYVGTLTKGKSLRATAAKLWMRLGRPQNVDLEVNGKASPIPTGTFDVLVTPRNVRPASA